MITTHSWWQNQRVKFWMAEIYEKHDLHMQANGLCNNGCSQYFFKKLRTRWLDSVSLVPFSILLFPGPTSTTHMQQMLVNDVQQACRDQSKTVMASFIGPISWKALSINMCTWMNTVFTSTIRSLQQPSFQFVSSARKVRFLALFAHTLVCRRSWLVNEMFCNLIGSFKFQTKSCQKKKQEKCQNLPDSCPFV